MDTESSRHHAPQKKTLAQAMVRFPKYIKSNKTGMEGPNDRKDPTIEKKDQWGDRCSYGEISSLRI